jgi:hypothetical protein
LPPGYRRFVRRQDTRLRIITNSPSYLVLVHRPVVVPTIAAALVIGVIVQAVGSPNALAGGEIVATGAGIVVGSIISYLSALPTRFVFDAARGVVVWQHFGWPGRVRGERPLCEVIGVEVHDDVSGASRVVLSTARGVIPLTRHFIGFDRHTENAAAIRDWLANHRASTPAV